MKHENNTLKINGKQYITKSNSRGNQVKVNDLWYYYQITDNGLMFKRMIALSVDTELGKKRITRETKWCSSITEVNQESEDLRVDYRRGMKIYEPVVKKENTDISPIYMDAYNEVLVEEKEYAINYGKDHAYKKIVSHHLNYVFSNKELDFANKAIESITISDVKALKNSINALANKKGKSRQTITLVFGSIDRVLRHAYEKDYTDKVLHDVPIKASGVAKNRIGDDGFLTKSQFDYMLKVFDGDLRITKRDDDKTNEYRKKLYYTAINTLFYGGLRKSEMFGLKWKDILNNQLRVERSLKDVGLFAREKVNKYREVKPKTENGIRTQTLPSSLKVILQDWKDYCADFGMAVLPDDYIFLEVNGNHFTSTTFNRIYKRIVSKSGVEEKYGKKLNVHSMRHSTCSYLVTEMKKKNPNATLLTIEDSVGRYLGHSVGGNMVKEVYYHYYPDEKIDLLEQVLIDI